jgi:hypothetical protein
MLLFVGEIRVQRDAELAQVRNTRRRPPAAEHALKCRQQDRRQHRDHRTTTISSISVNALTACAIRHHRKL